MRIESKKLLLNKTSSWGGDDMSTGDKRKQRDELSEADREQILRLDIEKQQLKEREAIAQAKLELYEDRIQEIIGGGDIDN